MHERFAHWLGGVNVYLTDEVSKSRWAAVEALVHWATEPRRGLCLSVSAVAVASIPEEWRSEISGVLQGGDTSFSMIDNDAEVQVLAASAIVQLFADGGSAADAAALGVATGTFGNREPEATPGLARLAHDYLRRRAVSIRPYDETLRASAFISDQVTAVTRLSKKVSEALAQDDHDEALAPAAAVVALNEVVSTLAKGLENVAEAEFTAHNRLVQSQAVLSEENGILWWVINGYSRDLNKPRDQASAKELTLPSARELESLVTHGVPPAASIEYLRHTLSSARGGTPPQLTVAEAIGATVPDWRDSVTVALPEEGPDHLFPVLAGLRMVGEVPGTEDWTQALQARTGLAGDFADAPEEVGLQFLRELTLSRCPGSS